MKEFKDYLHKEQLSESSIREHIKNITYYMNWAKEQKITQINYIQYHELLGYVQSMKVKGIYVSTQNIRLNSIRKYYEYIKKQGLIESNPARRIHIKGQIKNIIEYPLTHIELEKLFMDYVKYIEEKKQSRYSVTKHSKAYERNILIVSLMIWQGIQSGDLNKLEIRHVNLNDGTIYIPSSKRSQNRQLKLVSKQIILFHHYLTEREFKTDQLFTCHANNTIHQIVSELRGINPSIKNAQHIRGSIILHWLKVYSKRQAQYMIGHKYISSTEKYEIQELTELSDLLSKHHIFS